MGTPRHKNRHRSHQRRAANMREAKKRSVSSEVDKTLQQLDYLRTTTYEERLAHEMKAAGRTAYEAPIELLRLGRRAWLFTTATIFINIIAAIAVIYDYGWNNFDLHPTTLALSIATFCISLPYIVQGTVPSLKIRWRNPTLATFLEVGRRRRISELLKTIDKYNETTSFPLSWERRLEEIQDETRWLLCR